MTKINKPQVRLNRLTRTKVYEDYLDLEYSLKEVIDIFSRKLDEINSLGVDLVSDPYIEYNYFGCDGGKDLEIRYQEYIETEEEWKLRVKAEKKALAEWEADETNQKILKLESELEQLKKGVDNA